jgi:hypothetical protein
MKKRARVAVGGRVPRRAVWVVVLAATAVLSGCATDFGDANARRPNAVARTTRAQLDPIRDPIPAADRTSRRVVDGLTTRPNSYEAILEQSQDGVGQIGHWWDAVADNPPRTQRPTGPRKD